MKFPSRSAAFWITLRAMSYFRGVAAQFNDTFETIDYVPLFDKCDVEMYYAPMIEENPDPMKWSKENLTALIKETHRRNLPTNGYQMGDDDVYSAIIDLDPGTEPSTVRLVYRDINMGDSPYANPLYWDIERLWPEARGYNRFSPAYTDVHQAKPADSTVLLLKGILSFGLCDTVEYADACISPANSETAYDTAQDGKIWQPPEVFRGEIARALLYMDLRYEQLTLQDCGPFDNAMGYLSQMLQWHLDHPPDESEVRRNNRACGRWQGNRNPFIDYPELAVAFHGQPEDIVAGTRTYPRCISLFPTTAPTATANECGSIRRGDLPIFLVNSDEPDEVMVLPLVDLPAGLELFLSDEAWNGTHLLDGMEKEGVQVMVTPEMGISQGTLFGYGPNVNLGEFWEPERGEFSLNTDFGDNVFLYCIDADSKIHFLSGYSNYGNWSDAGLTTEEYGESTSSLPEEIRRAAIILPHLDNYFYNGSRDETIFLLRADMLNPASWVGSNEGRFGVQVEEESGTLGLALTQAACMLSFLSLLLV